MILLLKSLLVFTAMAASEEVQVGDIHMAISRDCNLTFANSHNQKGDWRFPAPGPCYFAKDRKGKVKVYQHVKSNSQETPRLLLAHSSKPISTKECEGQNVGVMVKEGKVLVSLPPYVKYTMCIGPQGRVDEKNYSYYWFTFLQDEKFVEIPLR